MYYIMSFIQFSENLRTTEVFKMDNGKKNWYIVDGYLPYAGEVKDAGFEGHEAVMILNCQDTPATVKMDIYFEEEETE